MKLHPALLALRTEIYTGRLMHKSDPDDMLSDIIWAIDALSHYWSLDGSDSMRNRLTMAFSSLPYDTSEIETPPTEDFGPYLTKQDRG